MSINHRLLVQASALALIPLCNTTRIGPNKILQEETKTHCSKIRSRHRSQKVVGSKLVRLKIFCLPLDAEERVLIDALISDGWNKRYQSCNRFYTCKDHYFLFYLLDWSNRIGPKCLLIASELVTEVRRKFPPDFISSPVRARDRKTNFRSGINSILLLLLNRIADQVVCV